MQLPVMDGPNPFAAVRGDERQAAYAVLMACGPVHRFEFAHGQEAWLVLGHQEVRELLRHPAVVKGGPERAPFAGLLPAKIAAGIHQHTLYADPPNHTRLRGLITSAFSSRRIESLEPRLQAMTDDLLDEMSHHETSDIFPALAYPLPIGAICTILGIPAEDRDIFHSWTQPLLAPFLVGPERFTAVAAEFLDYLRNLIAAKRRRPADDLLSDLIAAQAGVDRLTDDEVTSMAYLLLLAGHETTVNLIGNGIRALLTNPAQVELLRAQPQLWPQAIDELIRYDGPLQTTMPYYTTSTVTVGGDEIPPASMVYAGLLASGRDASRFHEPDRLDVTRSTAHVGFGHGLHRCVGAPLARLEATIALRGLFTRFPRLQATDDLQQALRSPAVLLNGLQALRVRLH